MTRLAAMYELNELVLAALILAIFAIILIATSPDAPSHHPEQRGFDVLPPIDPPRAPRDGGTRG